MDKITQTTLSEYRELMRSEQKLRCQRTKLRDRIIAMIESGSTVEPGPLTCRVMTVRARRLTRNVVIAAFGAEHYEALIAGIELTCQRILRVISSKGNEVPDAASRRAAPNIESQK
jgi:uncharacterized membrane protein YgcG